MRIATLLLLAACHSAGSPTTPPPVGHAPDPQTAAPSNAGAPKPVCAIEPAALAGVSATTGAIAGGICDSATGEALAGVTIVVTSAAQGQQTAITDEGGRFVVEGLAPGTYLVSIYYADITLEVPDVVVAIGKQAWVAKALVQTTSETIDIR